MTRCKRFGNTINQRKVGATLGSERTTSDGLVVYQNALECGVTVMALIAIKKTTTVDNASL